MLIQYSPINPMKALFWSAVINGVVAVPLMVVVIVLSLKKSVMGEHTATRSLVVLSWIGTGVMAVGAVCMVVLPGLIGRADRRRRIGARSASGQGGAGGLEWGIGFRGGCRD